MTAILAADTHVFGVINSATPGTMAFTPTPGCTYLVALVGYANSDPLVYPKVAINGMVMQVLSAPYMIDADRGAIMALGLEILAPIAGVASVTISCVAEFLGYTSVALFATNGSAGLFGKVVPGMIGAHDAGDNTGTINMTGIAAGSSLAFLGCTFFGGASAPTTIDHAPPEWTGAGEAVGVNQSAFGFWRDIAVPGDYAITLSSSTTWFYMLCLGVEILNVGARPVASPVEITNARLIDLGVIGGQTVTTSFNAGGASLMLFAATRTNNTPTGPASYTIGGQKVVFDFRFSAVHLDTETVVDIAFIAEPPAGTLAIVATGQNGYFGYTTLGLLGLKSLSGVVGARAVLAESGQGPVIPLGDGQPGSRLIALVATIFPRTVMQPNYGWSTVIASDASPAITESIFTAVGGPGQALVLKSEGYSAYSVLAFEFQTLVATVPTITGSGGTAQLPPTIAGGATNLHKLTPTGQDFHVYWETWQDVPNKALELLVPDDFYLARIPSFVTDVLLSFGIPRCTWAGPDDPLKPTTGLNFPTTARLLKATLDLLRSRNPVIQVWIAVQQNTPEAAHNEPYDPQGWWGMDGANVASWGAFCAYIGAIGIIIDYECISQSPEPDHHCVRDIVNDTVACFTDADMLRAIKTLRAGLPRPFKLILDGVHVGAYGVGPYRDARPNGPNSGYDYCLSQDAEAMAALDGIHAMTYDAGSDYDPITAISAFKHMFPGMPLWFGLRTGPFQYQNVKQTADQMMNYANSMIMMGLQGCHMYSGMWDVAYTGRTRPHGGGVTDGNFDDGDPPFGNYRPAFPDGNIAAGVVARVFNLGADPVPPGIGVAEGTRNNALRLNNRALLNGIMQAF